MTLNPDDLQITTYEEAIQRRTTMSIVHKPTSTRVMGYTTMSTHRLREKLMQELEEKLQYEKGED